MSGVTTIDADLRYIDAGHVDTPSGRLGEASVVTSEHRPIGKLDGIVVDPTRRQVRFYVVEAPGWFKPRHYLLPLTPVRLDRDHNALEVDVDAAEISRLDEVEPATFRRFSDDDLIDALFH